MIHTLFSVGINGWAVLLSTVLAMVLGYLWYGPLFSGPWGRLTGWTPEKIKTLSPGALARQYGGAFVLAVLLSLTTAVLVPALGSQTAVDAWVVALVVGVGFVAASMGTVALFEQQPFALFAIHFGYRLLTMVISATVISLVK